MSEERVVTRRDFMRDAAAGTAAMSLGLPAAQALARQEQRHVRVVLVRDENVLDDEGGVQAPVLAQMLDDAVTTLFENTDPAAVWRRLLRSDDVLGIKTNVYRPLRTPPELEQAIKERALEVGISEEDISIRDRGLPRDPIFLRATALINARPLRAHDWSGIGGCLKNYITFDNPPEWHDDVCADLGGLWNLPICAGKTRLNILVLLTPFFHSIGPHRYDPEAVWEYKGMMVSTDPVALDALGVKLLDEMRNRFYERPPRGVVSSKHVGYADTRHGIGIANLDEIELIKIGWTEDTLI
jgi:hypothetical protein